MSGIVMEIDGLSAPHITTYTQILLNPRPLSRDVLWRVFSRSSTIILKIIRKLHNFDGKPVAVYFTATSHWNPPAGRKQGERKASIVAKLHIVPVVCSLRFTEI